jgi:hypothetical protein
MRRVLPLAVAGICLIGIVVRIAVVAADSSLWFDEASLTVNLLSRSYRELAGALDLQQAAPVGFLWVERFAGLAGAGREAAFRAFPLAAGLAVLVLLAVLGWRIGGPRLAALATALAAFSPSAIWYSTEVKPYALDGLATLGIVLLTLSVLRAPDQARRWIALAVTGAVAFFFSTISIFTMAAAGLVLVWRFARDRQRAPLAWTLGIGAVWVAVFLGLYVAIVRPSEQMMRGTRYWDVWMLTIGSPDLAFRWRRALHEIFAESTYSIAYSWPMLGALLVAIGVGLFALARGPGRTVAIMAVATYVMIIAGAVAGRVPPAARLVFSLAPFTWLALAAGAVALIERAPAKWQESAVIAASVALLLWRWPVVRINDPMGRRHERSVEVIARVVDAAKGKHVYVGTYMIPVWLHYATPWNDREEVSRLRVRLRSRRDTRGDGRSRPFPVSELGRPQQLTRWTEIFGRYSLIDDAGVAASPKEAEKLEQWAAKEIRTIRAAGADTAWIVIAPWNRTEAPALARAAEQQCGHVLVTYEQPGAVAHQVAFDDPSRCPTAPLDTAPTPAR